MEFGQLEMEDSTVEIGKYRPVMGTSDSMAGWEIRLNLWIQGKSGIQGKKSKE